VPIQQYVGSLIPSAELPVTVEAVGAETDLRAIAARAEPRAADGGPTTMPAQMYQRLVRIVSYLFLAAVAAVNLIASPDRFDVYILLVVGIVLLVFFQDILPPERMSRWRLRLEAIAVIVFLAVLVALTGGYASPYFFGFVLLLGAGSLWATGGGSLLLALLSIVAYVIAVLVGSWPQVTTPEAAGRVAFNVVALALVAYIGWVIGREQRRAREEALRLSRFDALTGLLSRAFFISTVEREIPRAARTGRGFALLMFDMDGLKAANDRFGHEAGDRLIQAVADSLRNDIRAADIPARYAGDEFVVLLPETDLPGALHVAEKIRMDISRLSVPQNGSFIRTTASIGLVTYPEDGRTWSELIRRADVAMYEAKRRGRDQIVHYAREVPPVAEPQPPAATAISPDAMSVGGASGAGGVGGGQQMRPMGPGGASARGGLAGGPFTVPAESPGRAPWETRGA
jgi:diguanylate cyclase (GGDEF)-like protein